MNVTEFVEDEFNHWYNTVYVPNYEKVPGLHQGQALQGGERLAPVFGSLRVRA